MPRNGSGSYNLPANSWYPPVNGVTATSADWNTTATDIQSALSQSVSSDGQTPMTGNLQMGNNKITGIASGAAVTDAATIGQLQAAAGQAGGTSERNLLVNSNFAINQRVYASGAATTVANQVTLDRWRVVTTGQSITFGAAAPDRVATFPAGGGEQVIEAGWIVGGIYTLSWTGAGTAKVNGVAITNGGNTTSLAANTAVTIQFVGAIDRAQFELGTTATPWQRRPPGLELLLCQREYAKSYPAATIPGAVGANGRYWLGINLSGSITGFLPFPVNMRVAPTVTLWDGNGNVGKTGSFSSAGAFTPNITAGAASTDRGVEVSAAVGTDVAITGQWSAATGF
jgi:hypothetical protein